SKSEDYDLIHMSGKHRTVTEEINTLVSLCPDINKRFHFAKSPNDPELYHSVGYGNKRVYLSTEVIENMKNPLKVGKHLPYIPMKIGSRYFMRKRSEYSIVILMSYDDSGCILQKENSSIEHVVNVGPLTDDLFHEEITKTPDKTRLCNFQIAPANIMSIHSAQGRTILGKVSIILSDTSQHGAYVAMSRCSNPDDIIAI